MINTSMYNIIHSELNNAGMSEFITGNFIGSNSYIKKILMYDDDVEKIVNSKFFMDICLDSKESDRRFKRHFISRFMNYGIGHQTLEAFASQVVYTMYNNIDFLNEYFDSLNDYITGKSTTINKGKDTNISDGRNALASLPQSEVNINVDDTVLNYADENNISRQKSVNERENEANTFNYDIDNLNKFRSIFEEILLEFERNCFLKVW